MRYNAIKDSGVMHIHKGETMNVGLILYSVLSPHYKVYHIESRPLLKSIEKLFGSFLLGNQAK